AGSTPARCSSPRWSTSAACGIPPAPAPLSASSVPITARAGCIVSWIPPITCPRRSAPTATRTEARHAHPAGRRTRGGNRLRRRGAGAAAGAGRHAGYHDREGTAQLSLDRFPADPGSALPDALPPLALRRPPGPDLRRSVRRRLRLLRDVVAARALGGLRA